MKNICWVIDFLAAIILALFLYGLDLLNFYLGFKPLFFDLILNLLLFSSILFMLIFIYKTGCTPFNVPYKIPWPSFICMIVLSTSVSFGFLYYSIFKLAFRECPHASDGDGNDLFILTMQRILIIILTILSVFYLMKRAHFGSLDKKFDLLSRFTINFTLIFLRLQLIDEKISASIEDICFQSDDFNSILEIFCSPNKHGQITNISTTHSNSICNERTENELIWVILDRNLLHPTIISIATEMVPVLLCIHWLVCGYGEQRAEMLARQCKIKVEAAIKVPSFIFNMVSTTEPSQNPGVPEISKIVRQFLKISSILLILLGISNFLAAFYIYFRTYDGHHELISKNAMDKQIKGAKNFIKFALSGLHFLLRLLIYLWTRNISCAALDLNFMADSTCDRFLMYMCIPFLIPATIAYMGERMYFIWNFGSNDEKANIFLLIVGNLPNLLKIMAKCLETLSLCQLLALPKQTLQRQKHNFFGHLIIASIVLNFCDFFGTYFNLNQIAQHLHIFIDALRQNPTKKVLEAFTVLAVAAKLLTFSNFLFTFTCAIAWIEILLRYRKKRCIYQQQQNGDGIDNNNNMEMEQIQHQIVLQNTMKDDLVD